MIHKNSFKPYKALHTAASLVVCVTLLVNPLFLEMSPCAQDSSSVVKRAPCGARPESHIMHENINECA